MGYVIGILWPLTVVGAFVGGLLLYRSKAKQFAALEATAKAKGKSIEDVLKSI